MFAVGHGQIVISIAQGYHLPRSSISLLPSERKEEETDSLAFTMVLSPSGTQTSYTAKRQTTSLCPQKQSLGLSLPADPSNHTRESSCPSLLYLLSLNPRIPLILCLTSAQAILLGYSSYLDATSSSSQPAGARPPPLNAMRHREQNIPLALSTEADL